MKHCIHCGKGCNRGGKKFCSITCQAALRTEKLKKDFLEGKPATHWTARKVLMLVHNNSCSLCGWDKKNTVTGKCPLEVDHIDGDWRNNTVNNLRLLCPNCHSLTPTFRALNKRPADRKVKGQRKDHGGPLA